MVSRTAASPRTVLDTATAGAKVPFTGGDTGGTGVRGPGLPGSAEHSYGRNESSLHRGRQQGTGTRGGSRELDGMHGHVNLAATVAPALLFRLLVAEAFAA